MLLLVFPNLEFQLHFLCCFTCRSMHLTCMRRPLQACVQAIGCWPFVTITTCCAISTLGRGSSVGSIAVDVKCLCHVTLAMMLIAPVLAGTRRVIMRRMFRRLCDVLMGSCYQILVPCSLICVFRLVTFVLPSFSIIGHLIEILSFVCVLMPGYLLPGIKLNCSPFPVASF